MCPGTGMSVCTEAVEDQILQGLWGKTREFMLIL